MQSTINRPSTPEASKAILTPEQLVQENILSLIETEILTKEDSKKLINQVTASINNIQVHLEQVIRTIKYELGTELKRIYNFPKLVVKLNDLYLIHTPLKNIGTDLNKHLVILQSITRNPISLPLPDGGKTVTYSNSIPMVNEVITDINNKINTIPNVLCSLPEHLKKGLEDAIFVIAECNKLDDRQINITQIINKIELALAKFDIVESKDSKVADPIKELRTEYKL